MGHTQNDEIGKRRRRRRMRRRKYKSPKMEILVKRSMLSKNECRICDLFARPSENSPILKGRHQSALFGGEGIVIVDFLQCFCV
jgi:hypothetical protein